MDSPEIWLMPALIVALEIAAYTLYARAILGGRVVPSRASWLIWTPLLWLTTASSLDAGAGLAAVKTLATAVGVTWIAVLAMRHGTGGWSRCDRVCFALTAAGVAGWAILDDPVLGLALFILADATGAIPTLRDLVRDPSRERPAYWLLGGVTSLLALALVGTPSWVISSFGFAQWGYPIYQFGVNAAVLAVLASTLIRRQAVLARIDSAR